MMLRPACLLSPWRLVTPRSSRGTLIPRLGSATRRSGAYRDGTRTRWRKAAWSGGCFSRSVTTHHALDYRTGLGARGSGAERTPSPESRAQRLLLHRLVNRAAAAADRGADERTLLAAEDGADARAG